MSDQKSEKKLMEEKITAVRAVVPNVKKDEIIMALYNFELDVEATIRAFCEDGAAGALDEWVRPVGSASKKNKKKTAAAAKANGGSSASSTVTPTPTPSVATPQKIVNGAPKANGSAAGPLKANGGPKAAAVPTTNGVAKQPEPAHHVEKKAEPSPSKPQQHQQTNGRVPASGQDVESTIRAAFKELRAALQERENKLLADAARPGARFNIDTHTAHSYFASLGQVVVPGEKPTKIIETPSKETPLRHGTSHSSLGSSSLGDDSAIGQSSPLASEEPARPMHAVQSGGMQIQSDAISEEQLAELQRKVQETLLAQGIDPSVLSGISTGSSAASQRHRQERQDRRQAERGGRGGARGGGHAGRGGRNAPAPELSILNKA